ncbi:MAG TPA: type II secretion system protein GspJ [Tepidisphaeraceae bacterium]|jgi:prepilin-type N-terminal cleavage/methylation domain-containing protein
MTHARGNHLRTRARGFTLIELVVALSMVVVLAASLSSTLWLAYHATQRTEAAVNPSRQAAIMLDYLASDFQNAMQAGSATTTLIGNFEGTQAQDDRGHEADDVIFFSTAESPQHVDANGEVKQIELTVEHLTGSNDYALVRRVTRNLMADIQPAPDEEIICRGVSSFTLQYFDGSNWDTTWDSTVEDKTIPAAVQVKVELTDPNASPTAPPVIRERIIPLLCSTAALDSSVNTGVTTP